VVGSSCGKWRQFTILRAENNDLAEKHIELQLPALPGKLTFPEGELLFRDSESLTRWGFKSRLEELSDGLISRPIEIESRLRIIRPPETRSISSGS
jgi:hypothetical protein